MQDVDDLPRQALELVVQVVREMVDALVRALHPEADLGQVLGVLDPDLVEFAANLAQKFFQLLLERRPPLEVVKHLEKDSAAASTSQAESRAVSGIGTSCARTK